MFPEPRFPVEDVALEFGAMDETDYAGKLEELERLLNDPDVNMEPNRVWSLLAEVSQYDRAAVYA